MEFDARIRSANLPARVRDDAILLNYRYHIRLLQDAQSGD
jgi:hypothetical protein